MQLFKQSPINIDIGNLQAIQKNIYFNYNNEQFHVFNNGQNISLMPTNCKSFITFDKKQFHLSEIHFHLPSEHHISSKHFDMEVHLVHQEDHETIVYGVLLKISNDGFNFGQPFSNIDQNITLELTRLVPTTCFHYNGSFTTKPYDEVVTWLINTDIYTISEYQAELFSVLYPNNNRCLQPLNNRLVSIVHTSG